MSLALYPGRCQKRLGTWNGARSFQLQSWDLETVALMSLSSDPHKSRKGVGERSKRWYAKLPASVQSRRPGGKGGDQRVFVNYACVSITSFSGGRCYPPGKRESA